jgi:hypothetical protein
MEAARALPGRPSTVRRRRDTRSDAGLAGGGSDHVARLCGRRFRLPLAGGARDAFRSLAGGHCPRTGAAAAAGPPPGSRPSFGEARREESGAEAVAGRPPPRGDSCGQVEGSGLSRRRADLAHSAPGLRPARASVSAGSASAASRSSATTTASSSASASGTSAASSAGQASPAGLGTRRQEPRALRSARPRPPRQPRPRPVAKLLQTSLFLENDHAGPDRAGW